MSEAEYEVIKATFPDWACMVEMAAEDVAKGDAICIDYWKGQLVGLANGMLFSKQCSRAWEFVVKATEDAKARFGKEANA